jgi:hypothetical protein
MEDTGAEADFTFTKKTSKRKNRAAVIDAVEVENGGGESPPLVVKRKKIPKAKPARVPAYPQKECEDATLEGIIETSEGSVPEMAKTLLSNELEELTNVYKDHPFVLQTINAVSEKFILELGQYNGQSTAAPAPQDDKENSSENTKPNPRNIALGNELKALKSIHERLQREEKLWNQAMAENQATSTDASTALACTEVTAPPALEDFEEVMHTFSEQIDALDAAVKDTEAVVQHSKQAHARMYGLFEKRTFKGYDDVAEPKKLIRGLIGGFGKR